MVVLSGQPIEPFISETKCDRQNAQQRRQFVRGGHVRIFLSQALCFQGGEYPACPTSVWLAGKIALRGGWSQAFQMQGKLTKGQAFEYRVPARHGLRACGVEGEGFDAIGTRTVNVWDGEPEGV